MSYLFVEAEKQNSFNIKNFKKSTTIFEQDDLMSYPQLRASSLALFSGFYCLQQLRSNNTDSGKGKNQTKGRGDVAIIAG